MYCKYNAELRDIGEVQRDGRAMTAAMAEDEISNSNRFAQNKKKGGDCDQLDLMATCTEGNLYTTTLHVINSCVLKLGKLARAGMVRQHKPLTSLGLH